MKFNFKGIKFNTWLYFLGFSVAMLSLLGFLLVALIRPYYRENRIRVIDTIVDTIETSLLSEHTDETAIAAAGKLIVGNNACVIIYNQNGRRIYSSDSLGELCMLDETITVNGESLNVEKEADKTLAVLDQENTLKLSLTSPLTGYEMMLYGKKIVHELASYYLIINTPSELLESYVDFILNQYVYVSIAVIVVALIVAFLLANRITSPIIRMRQQAKKLAQGDYDVHFLSRESYSEINDLALTLDDAKDKLSKVDELRKDLMANVSHDLRTPLTLIQSYAEMIRDISGEDPKKRNEHLDVILKESQYLTRLINDVQEYSKMQAGYIELNKGNFDLKEVCENVCELLDGLLKEKKILLKKELCSSLIYADEVKISQVVYNFLSNAIKHSKEGSLIIVRMEDCEEKLRLEVIDHGEGIDEAALPYIWDRYYRIDKSFRRNENSTGLGLAIAKAILEAHKAAYGVFSHKGEGSTFYFEITKDYDDETD